MSLSRSELLSAFFPHPVRGLSLRETHLSFVVLTGDFAYKIKKDIRLEFVDASTLERRRALCAEELRLNQRFAPDLYLNVAPIVRAGARLQIDAAGEPVEFAVRMRQFDARDELDAALARGDVSRIEIARLGERVADLHRSADRGDTSVLQPTNAFLDVVRANVASILQRAPQVGAEALAAELQRWTELELSKRLDRLRARERQDYIRECHGDLHARNVVRWRGELTPFDCLEFDPALRFIDTLSDLAFLVMDLLHDQRTDLAFTLLNRYLECSGDYLGADLLPCYMVHRALVRAKVDLIEAQQHPDSPAPRTRALERLQTARRLAQSRTPALIVMHGASGSGKSWLSERLSPEIGAVRIRSDLERKRLAGPDPLAVRYSAFNEGIYTQAFNDRTYAHLLDCARACLRGAFNVIVDAAFLKHSERNAFARLASGENARFTILSCGADPATLAARIEARRTAATDPSDATVDVLQYQLRTMQPFDAAEEPHLIRIDTRDPDVLAETSKRIDATAI